LYYILINYKYFKLLIVKKENKNKYFLKSKRPGIKPVKENNKYLGDEDYHNKDLLYLLLNKNQQNSQKKNTLKRINNYVQDDNNILDQQINHFPHIPPIPSNRNKRVKVIEEDQEDIEAVMEIDNNNNSRFKFHMQPNELKKKNSPFKFIEYIKQHPETKEFIYCNIMQPKVAKGQPSYDPYNLEVVEYSNIDKSNHYYTLSAKVN